MWVLGFEFQYSHRGSVWYCGAAAAYVAATVRCQSAASVVHALAEAAEAARRAHPRPCEGRAERRRKPSGAVGVPVAPRGGHGGGQAGALSAGKALRPVPLPPQHLGGCRQPQAVLALALLHQAHKATVTTPATQFRVAAEIWTWPTSPLTASMSRSGSGVRRAALLAPTALSSAAWSAQLAPHIRRSSCSTRALPSSARTTAEHASCKQTKQRQINSARGACVA